MVTQIDSPANESSTAVRSHVEEVVLSEAALAEAEEILRLRDQAVDGGSWTRFQHWMTDRYSNLVGPPMTQQERLNVQLYRAAQEKQSTGFMWW